MIRKSTLSLLTASLLLAMAGCQSPAPASETAVADTTQTQDHGHGHGHGHHHGAANAYMHQSDFEDLVKRFEAPDRETWQKPAEVIAHMGDLTGKTVADLGAGTGYFSVRLAQAGAKVIALDVEQQFVDYLNQRFAQLPQEQAKQLQVRLTPYEHAALEAAEVDQILTVDTYHHFENRIEYFGHLRKTLKPGGTLVIVDFKPGDQPQGPPAEMKIAPDQIEKELKAAGFTTFELDNDLLPYQFILKAGG